MLDNIVLSTKLFPSVSRRNPVNDFMANDSYNSSKIVPHTRRCVMAVFATIAIRSLIIVLSFTSYSSSFSTSSGHQSIRCTLNRIAHEIDLSPRINSDLRMSDEWSDSNSDLNTWTSTNDNTILDWESENDRNLWSTFQSIEDEEDATFDGGIDDEKNDDDAQDDSELWLDALAAISAEEIEFNQMENERADKVRQMQEWGFDDETIKNAFDVEIDDSRETEDEVDGMKEYREDIYEYEEEEEDWQLVESHTRVEKDPETGESIRQQMIYVDEHACVGCYNCANIAQSTFFMEEEHGRARVFEQWGDDDETIACAIETCPVDCIHYVPYDELVRLETERRGQNINYKARFVNQGDSGFGTTVGATAYTAPSEISGNFGSRCNNCPSNGCKSCPMFGVGKNPEFEKKEQLRKERIERRRLQKQREEESKSVDL
mmetsp:Transcript_7231/g.17630  ORF Transcript_7231/g.17630 Transcript_7231/m.17630 type:complete len:432 (-) Transcript_7231:136-1431(-)